MSLIATSVVIAWGIYYISEQYKVYRRNQTDWDKNPMFIEDLRTQLVVDTVTLLVGVGIAVYFCLWVLKQVAPQFPNLEEVGFLPRSYRHRMIYGEP
jgi:hypothetical protein